MKVHPFTSIRSNRISFYPENKDIKKSDFPNQYCYLYLNAISSIPSIISQLDVDCLESTISNYFNVKSKNKAIFTNEPNTTIFRPTLDYEFNEFIIVCFSNITLNYKENKSIYLPKGSIFYCKQNDGYDLQCLFSKDNITSVSIFIYNV